MAHHLIMAGIWVLGVLGAAAMVLGCGYLLGVGFRYAQSWGEDEASSDTDVIGFRIEAEEDDTPIDEPQLRRRRGTESSGPG